MLELRTMPQSPRCTLKTLTHAYPDRKRERERGGRRDRQRQEREKPKQKEDRLMKH